MTFDESLRNVVKVTGLPLNELARTCSANQARSLGLKDRGSLKQGLLADLTLLTPDLKVAAVYVGGEKRFSA